jgi:hypothetical protein
MSTSTLPARCTVTSWLIDGDEPVDGTREDHGQFTWNTFHNIMIVAAGEQVTTDLWDAAQPDGTIRRYRAINATA